MIHISHCWLYIFWYKGVREHLKVCTKCNKKWAYVASKCGYNVTDFICQECNNSNDNDDSNKDKDNDKKKKKPKVPPIPAQTIKIFARIDSEEIDIIPQIDDSELPKVLELIQQAYKIDKVEHEFFKTFEIAKEYFVNKLYYAKSTENLLEFHYPECIKNRTNFSYPDNYFTLTYKDVMSLMDDNPISEGVIEFVVDCFNIYI